MKRFRFVAALFLALAPAGFAAQITYSTNFDDPTDFPTGESLSSYTSTAAAPGFGAPAAGSGDANLDWTTTDTNQNDELFAYTSNPYSDYTGDTWAAMGGNLSSAKDPSQSQSELWNPVSISTAFSFSLEFAITNSHLSPNDTFGLSFRDTASSNNALFQILFAPSGTNDTNGNPYEDVNWNTTDSNSSNTYSGLQIQQDAKYSIVVSGNLSAGTFSATITSLSNSSQGQFSGTMAATGQTLGEAGLTWIAANTSDPGSNLLLFNNYSVIPEPSAIASFAVGGIALVMMRRRRRSR